VERIDVQAQNKNKELQENMKKYMDKCQKLEVGLMTP